MNKKGEPTLNICKQKFKYLNYSQKTADLYLGYIAQFLNSQQKSAAHLNHEDFQKYLDTYSFTSISQQNQIINAIRFLYTHGLNRKYGKVKFTRPKKEKHLPKVIDSNLLIEKIDSIENLKHKTILSLAFSVGLRVSEIVNLKIEDIDSNRMLIYIKNAKGKKDRIVPLSEKMLKLLRNYWLKYKPSIFLFNGQYSEQYSIRSCQQIYKKYIDPTGHFHTLRHSCFTNLLETGTDLRIIQKIAGHSSSKTTEIYTHVSNQILSKVKTPI